MDLAAQSGPQVIDDVGRKVERLHGLARMPADMGGGKCAAANRHALAFDDERIDDRAGASEWQSTPRLELIIESRGTRS